MMTHQQLGQAIVDASLLRGDFVLRSGLRSNVYLDKYLFETQPAILREVARLFAERMPPGVTRIAGAELGGVPLATAVSLHTGLPFLIARNAKKDYGTSKPFEGKLEPGDRLLLVEDVATTGGQVLEAAQALRAAGADVAQVIAVIDREQGAQAALEAAGFSFDRLFTARGLGVQV